MEVPVLSPTGSTSEFGEKAVMLFNPCPATPNAARENTHPKNIFFMVSNISWL
jgi:hypothetical protein